MFGLLKSTASMVPVMRGGKSNHLLEDLHLRALCVHGQSEVVQQQEGVRCCALRLSVATASSFLMPTLISLRMVGTALLESRNSLRAPDFDQVQRLQIPEGGRERACS